MCNKTRYYPKHLMTGLTGNSVFCFSLTSLFHSASPQETLRVLGNIKCLLSLFNNILPHKRPLQASYSSVPEILVWSSNKLLVLYLVSLFRA